jgi:thioesterase domain-containing protein/acyl carrier protein
VPTVVLPIDRLPLTAHGKLDRAALPAPDPATSAAHSATGRTPRTPTEEAPCAVFADLLGLPRVGIDDSFFDLGGDSVQAARLVSQVRDRVGIDLPIRSVFEMPTVAGLLSLVDARRAGAGRDAFDLLLQVRPDGSRPPIFCIHPSEGIGWAYHELARHLPGDHPVFAIQARGIAEPAALPSSLAAMAADYAGLIRHIVPDGPYHLVGWSFGGHVAHAIAAHLQRIGQEVGLLAVLDAYPPHARPATRLPGEPQLLAQVLRHLGRDADGWSTADEVRAHALAAVADLLGQPAGDAQDRARAVLDVLVHNLRLMAGHVPETISADLLFFSAARGRTADAPTAGAWRPYVRGRIDDHDIDYGHHDMLRPDPAAEIGRRISAALAPQPGGDQHPAAVTA